jgi:NADH:ubiquinone oxidoreductase subunit B-like Fe-S oxidoreductase
MGPVVVYVPGCVQNGSETLGLKMLEEHVKIELQNE